RVLVANSQATVRWMKETGGVKMEPAITLSAVKKDNVMVWARGLVVRAEHEGVGLSRSWFETAERMGIEIRYGSAAFELIVADSGKVAGVKTKEDDGIKTLTANAVVLGCGGFEANVQMRTQHIGPLVGAARQGLPAVRQQGHPPARAALPDERADQGRYARGSDCAARHRRQGAGAQDRRGIQRSRARPRRGVRPEPQGRPLE